MLNKVEEMAMQAVDTAIGHGLVERKAKTFRAHFQAKITHGVRCVGGLKRRPVPTPFIRIGRHNRHAALDRQLDFNQAILTPPKKKIWRQAWDFAQQGKSLYVEYSHVHNDPVIGGFVSNDPEDHLTAVILHEVAHAIQHWEALHGDEVFRPIAHGTEWRIPYRVLRRTYGLVRGEDWELDRQLAQDVCMAADKF